MYIIIPDIHCIMVKPSTMCTQSQNPNIQHSTKKAGQGPLDTLVIYVEVCFRGHLPYINFNAAEYNLISPQFGLAYCSAGTDLLATQAMPC